MESKFENSNSKSVALSRDLSAFLISLKEQNCPVLSCFEQSGSALPFTDRFLHSSHAVMDTELQ
jgi:hypothetical protein